MTDDCSHQVRGSSQSSSVEPHLDYTEIDESTSILDAGFGNDLERDHDLAPPTRSIDDGTRDESTRQIPASAVKRTRLGLIDPRSSYVDEGQQDISDVYRNSPPDTVCELTLRGRSVRKRPVVPNHRPATDVDSGGPRRELGTSTTQPTITGGRQSPTTASTSGLPCASPSRHALMPPSDSMDVCDHEQPASDPPRSTCYLGARVAPLANRPSAAARHNGILEVPYDPSLRLNGVSDHHLQETPFPDELDATTSFRHNGALDTPLPAGTKIRHRWILLSSLSVL